MRRGAVRLATANRGIALDWADTPTYDLAGAAIACAVSTQPEECLA